MSTLEKTDLSCFEACKCLEEMGVLHPFHHKDACFKRVGLGFEKPADFNTRVEEIKAKQHLPLQ